MTLINGSDDSKGKELQLNEVDTSCCSQSDEREDTSEREESFNEEESYGEVHADLENPYN